MILAVSILAAPAALARSGVWIGIGPAYSYGPYSHGPYPSDPYPYAPYPYAPPGWGPGPYAAPSPYGVPAYPAPPAAVGRWGLACYAGPAMCQLDQPGPVGAACSCPVRPGERALGRIAE